MADKADRTDRTDMTDMADMTQTAEAEARQKILSLVSDYCDKYHNVAKDFSEGDRIPYASRVYDNKEMVNLVDSALEFWLTSGRYTDEFEKNLAKYLGEIGRAHV